MKRFSGIIVVLLFLCVDICAQNREVMVWGIPFASSKKDLIAAIQANAPDAIIVDVRHKAIPCCGEQMVFLMNICALMALMCIVLQQNSLLMISLRGHILA